MRNTILTVALLAASAAQAATNILCNGTFELATDGVPDRWTLSSAAAGGLFNAGTQNNMLGEDKVGVNSLYLVQPAKGDSAVHSISQTTTAVVPGLYRIRLQSFPYFANGKEQQPSSPCMVRITTENGTAIVSERSISKDAYSASAPYTYTFAFPDAHLGAPLVFTMLYRASTSIAKVQYRAIDNVELQLYILEVAAKTELVYTNGIMSAEQSIYVRENATLVFKVADGFETLPSVSLWDGAKIRIDCAGWKGGEATLTTLRGFLGPSQGAALADPLSRIELVNASGATATLSADGKSVTISREQTKCRGFLMKVK